MGILVRNSAAFLEQELMLHNIMLQLSIEVSHEQVLGDELMLSLVFVNIYRNAKEALHHQKIKIIYVSVATKNNHIVIVVQDTGLGVGLSISRSIIEQNGGQLFISNAEEGGAMNESKLPQILS
jgi:two-component system sensor kinase FixL